MCEVIKWEIKRMRNVSLLIVFAVATQLHIVTYLLNSLQLMYLYLQLHVSTSKNVSYNTGLLIFVTDIHLF